MRISPAILRRPFRATNNPRPPSPESRLYSLPPPPRLSLLPTQPAPPPDAPPPKFPPPAVLPPLEPCASHAPKPPLAMLLRTTRRPAARCLHIGNAVEVRSAELSSPHVPARTPCSAPSKYRREP